jgi:hypothetical protein
LEDGKPTSENHLIRLIIPNMKSPANAEVKEETLEAEHEYISEEELKRLENIKLSGDFIDQDNLIEDLGIKKMKYNIKYEKRCLKYLKRFDKNTHVFGNIIVPRMADDFLVCCTGYAQRSEPWPVMHKPVQWEEVKAFFLQQQKLLLDECI